jgi:hypothetical protein
MFDFFGRSDQVEWVTGAKPKVKHEQNSPKGKTVNDPTRRNDLNLHASQQTNIQEETTRRITIINK